MLIHVTTESTATDIYQCCICVYTHTHLYKINIPRSAPTQLEVQSSPKGILAWEERQNPPTDPEQAEMFSPCHPFCQKPPFYTMQFCPFPKGWNNGVLQVAVKTGWPWPESLRTETYSLMEKLYIKARFSGWRGSADLWVLSCASAMRPPLHSSHPSVAKPCSSQEIRSPAHAFPN